jgi:hypothetical protein
MRAPLAGELIKIRTVRGPVWALVAALVVGVGFSALVGTSMRGAYPGMSAERRADFDALSISSYGVIVSQLAFVIFAVLAVGGEYASGTIRASLLAIPRRGRFYAAKVLATALPVGAVALVLVPVAFFTAQTALGPYGVSPGEPGVPRLLVGSWLYVVLLTLFALGVTAMLRAPARALGLLLPVFLLGSQGLGNVPGVGAVTQYLPDQAGAVILHMAGPPEDLRFDRDFGPWTGLGILALWTAAALFGGCQVLRRRDA